MSIRRHKRFIITLHAKVRVGDEIYEGLIGNVSEEGISSTITTYVKTDNKFYPNKKIGLSFDLPSGRPVDLMCEVRWFLKPSKEKETLILGLYILDPPSQYKEWINQFQ